MIICLQKSKISSFTRISGTCFTFVYASLCHERKLKKFFVSQTKGYYSSFQFRRYFPSELTVKVLGIKWICQDSQEQRESSLKNYFNNLLNETSAVTDCLIFENGSANVSFTKAEFSRKVKQKSKSRLYLGRHILNVRRYQNFE
jgi:hypothetical protein